MQLYEMRHKGLRRKFKPFPGASDLHFPLIDTNIEKLKPLFFQQVVGMDTVASFISRRPQDAALSTVAEQWFDYKVREKSNLQEVSLAWIDFGLMSGRSVIKVDWDFDNKRLKYEAIPTLNNVLPTYARGFDDTDWWVHVIPMSKDAYTRDGRYDASAETLEKICGGEGETNSQNNDEQTREIREGITHSDDENRVIVWEVYRRVAKDKVVILTYSPQAPDIDLRPQRELPFVHQELPGVDFQYEITDGGWYSPRGVADILAPFEVSLCSTWNHKHDSMAFYTRPMFRAEREMPNTGNMRMSPGGILPYGLVPVPVQQTPVDFDNDMTLTRSIAEQRVANPDYGIGQVIDTKNRRTATEVDAITAQSQSSGDLRARMFRMALVRLYRQSWRLLLQYNKEDLLFRVQDQVGVASEQALHLDYDIEPKGGLNEVNRKTKLNEAIALKQILGQSAYWDQATLERNIVELQNPSVVKTAFRDPNAKKQDEAADEMTTLPALLIGAPVPIKPGMDYVTRIGIDMQFLQNAKQSGQAIPPIGIQRIIERMDQMLTALEQQDTNTGRMLRNKVTQYLQQSGYVQANPQPIQK